MSAWRWYVVSFSVISFGYRWGRLAWTVRRAQQQPRGQRTARPVFWVMTSAYLALFFGAVAEALLRPSPPSWLCALAGLLLFITALRLRELVMRDLGRFFSPDIEIRHAHRVVSEGFYGWVRHPLLACLFLEIIGLGLALQAYWALGILGGLVYAPIIGVRLHLEEKALIRTLGEAYRQYQQNVGALWPRRQMWLQWTRRMTNA